MKVYELFNDESALFARIAGLRAEVARAQKSRPAGDALARRLGAFDGKLDALRKQIVATTEGGAITGEERLREHTDQLYGAITSWDGPPTRYQLANTVALRSQLDEISGSFTELTSKELPVLNKSLGEKGAAPLTVPSQTAFEERDAGYGGGVVADRTNPDAVSPVALPRNLRLWN